LLLVNPTDRSNTETTLRDVQAAKAGLSRMYFMPARSDIDKVFEVLARLMGGLVIGTDGFFISRSGNSRH
jgi:hypothetical protein